MCQENQFYAFQLVHKLLFRNLATLLNYLLDGWLLTSPTEGSRVLLGRAATSRRAERKSPAHSGSPTTAAAAPRPLPSEYHLTLINQRIESRRADTQISATGAGFRVRLGIAGSASQGGSRLVSLLNRRVCANLTPSVACYPGG